MLTNTIGIDTEGQQFDRLDEALGKVISLTRQINDAPRESVAQAFMLRWWLGELREIVAQRTVVQIDAPRSRLRLFWRMPS